MSTLENTETKVEEEKKESKNSDKVIEYQNGLDSATLKDLKHILTHNTTTTIIVKGDFTKIIIELELDEKMKDFVTYKMNLAISKKIKNIEDIVMHIIADKVKIVES